MKVHVLIFLGAFVTSVMATLMVRALARRWGVLDHPDTDRKVHTRAVPRLGGVAIYLAFFAPFLGILIFNHTISGQLFQYHLKEAIALFMASTLVLGVGIVDDVRGLKARYKLLVQLFACSILIVAGYRIMSVSNPFGNTPIVLGFLFLPVTLFWLMGSTNAFNLIDGLDGLAAGVGVFVCATLFFVALWFGNILMASFWASMGGALLGFLIFNRHPASIFLGDSGSLFLGFTIGAVALKGSQKSATVVALLIPVLALGLPIMDTTLAIIRRWYRGLPLTLGDREHLHHKLLSRGFSHRQAVQIMYGICVILALAAILMSASNNVASAMALGIVGVLAFAIAHLMGGLKLSKFRGLFRLARPRGSRGGTGAGARPRESALRLAHSTVRKMERQESIRGLWQVLTQALAQWEFDRASIIVEPPHAQNGAEPLELRWARLSAHESSSNRDAQFSRHLSLRVHGVTVGHFTVTRRDRDFAPETLEVVNILRHGAASRIWTMSGERTQKG